MKYKFSSIILSVVFTALFSACLEKENNQIEPVEDNTLTSNKFSQHILSNTANIYTDFLVQTDQSAGFSSMKEHSLAEHRIYTKFSENGEQLKSGANSFSVLANNIDLNSKQKSMETDQCLLADNWYGKNVSFLLKSGSLKNGENGEDTVNMYIPEQISITSPLVETKADQFPMCYSKNFILRWNKDVKNENGLVISVEWTGAMYAGELRKGIVVQNIDFIEEDDGEFILDEKIFDGIPDVAIAYITILRGNINIVTQDDGTTKVFGESHAILPFIMVKDLDKYYSMKP